MRAQGERFPRASRTVIAICAAGLAYPAVAAGNLLPAAAVWAVAFAIADVLFTRRMGFTSGRDELRLHRAFGTVRIPREDIAGTEWRTWTRRGHEYLYVLRCDGRPIRVPTVQRVEAAGGGWWARRLGSPLARTRDGKRFDAQALVAGEPVTPA